MQQHLPVLIIFCLAIPGKILSQEKKVTIDYDDKVGVYRFIVFLVKRPANPYYQ
ncbi:hypothetical protein HDF22_004886 [Mucilaginibacter lappiensis]|uniref:Uncharacterized protein n=1 Tax=Mucilaginibacter lappiensis TaxID=354630 RepID=A0A841JSB4_9SPHI|nr:hypothetical protein [Mucilaginibacter lappiensis]